MLYYTEWSQDLHERIWPQEMNLIGTSTTSPTTLTGNVQKCSERTDGNLWLGFKGLSLQTKIMTAQITSPRQWMCILSDFFKLTATCSICKNVGEFLLNQIVGDSIQV